MKDRRLAIIFLISICTVGLCLAIGYLWLFNPFSAESLQTRSAEAFLTNLLQGNDADALSYPSSHLRTYSLANCPNSPLIECINANIPQSWGHFSHLYLSVGDSVENRMLFYIVWNSLQAEMTPVVVEMSLENNQWGVDSFWGFIETDGEQTDAELLGAVRQDNLFPPTP